MWDLTGANTHGRLWLYVSGVWFAFAVVIARFPLPSSPLSQVSDELVLPKKIKAGKYVLSWCGPAYICVYYYYVWAGYVRANANCRIAEFIYKATHIYEFARILMAVWIGLGGHNSTKSILALAHALATLVALAPRATIRTDHGWRNSRDFLSLTPHSRELSLNYHVGHDSSFETRCAAQALGL